MEFSNSEFSNIKVLLTYLLSEVLDKSEYFSRT